MKKKILSIILLGCITLGLVGCGGTLDSDNKPSSIDSVAQDGTENIESVVSNDYNSFEFLCNGVKITLPCTYEDFHKTTGLNPKYGDTEVNHQSVVYQTYVYTKDNEPSFSLYMRNETGEEATYNDCSVIGIGQYERQAENSDIYVVFPGNLTIKKEVTEKELTEIFGKPDNIYIAEGAYTQYHWYINDVPNTGLTVETRINHKSIEYIESINLIMPR